MAFDAARGVVVLFGGARVGGVLLGDTWEWDGQTWTQRPVTGPSPRALHQMAYDAARGVTLLFGGNDGIDRGDTWRWDGSQWTLLDIPGPSPRVGHAMAYDADRGLVVLTGGAGFGPSQQVWEWDGATWSQGPNAPFNNAFHRMVYDIANHRMAILGSSFSQTGLRTYDGTSWSDRPISGPPQNRGNFAMAYDSTRSRVVLFAGAGRYGTTPILLGDTAELDGTIASAVADRPPYGRNLPMAYDSARRVSLMFGGVINSAELVTDTWQWNGTTWTRLATSGPTQRSGHALAYDSLRDRTVLFGGQTPIPPFSSETYEWNAQTAAWSLIPAAGPSARAGHAMAFDAARGVTLIFGGTAFGGPVADTWAWNGTTWSMVATAGPSPRTGARMAYDAPRQRVVLFGGYSAIGGNSQWFGDTWEWNGVSWSRRATTGPPARTDAAMAYDVARSVTVVVGGTGIGNSGFNDVWEWNGASWSQINLVGPSERASASMAHDAARGVTVLFGGADGTMLGATDTWELSGNLRVVSASGPQNASPGETVTMSVQVQHSSPVTYQWRRDGAPIADGSRVTGAQTPTLTLDPVELEDAGSYSVIVTDACGSFVASSPALLRVQFSVPYTIGRSFTASTYGVHSNFIPPDTMGAVGPAHVVELINGRFTIYSKTGTRLYSDTLNGFWASAGVVRDGPFAFDPRVIFDPYSARWYACAVDNARGPNNFLVAVSLGSNPLAGWRGFKIDSDSDNSAWADFPMLGLAQDAIVIAANMFPLSTAPFRTAVLVLPKSDLIAGNVSRRALFQDVNPSLSGPTPHPVLSLDDSPLRLLVSSFNKPAGTIRRTAVGGTVGAFSYEAVGGFYAVAPRLQAPGAIQPGGSVIDTGDDRFSSAPVQLGSAIWGAQTVEVGGRSAIEWYKLDAHSSTVAQAGVLHEPTLDFYEPSLAVNSAGNLVIGFTASGPTTFASAYAAVGHTVDGQMQIGRPFLVHPGVATYELFDGAGRNRWGDYSATCVDPTDPFRFWTFQEFAAATNTWSVRVTEIILPGAMGLCRPDLDADGNLDADDLSDYITCFFGVPPCLMADFNGDGGVDADDLADYITAYFIGCS